MYQKLRTIDPIGRQPFHQARCSIEMRFRIKIDMHAVRDREAAEAGAGGGGAGSHTRPLFGSTEAHSVG